MARLRLDKRSPTLLDDCVVGLTSPATTTIDKNQ
jgi:hypothetical protein